MKPETVVQRVFYNNIIHYFGKQHQLFPKLTQTSPRLILDVSHVISTCNWVKILLLTID